MIFPIKPKTEPKIGTIRVIQRYSFLPTKVEISNGVWGWVWLERWEERQRFEKVAKYITFARSCIWVNDWRTIAKTLKTKTAPKEGSL